MEFHVVFAEAAGVTRAPETALATVSEAGAVVKIEAVPFCISETDIPILVLLVRVFVTVTVLPIPEMMLVTVRKMVVLVAWERLCTVVEIPVITGILPLPADEIA